MTLNQDFYFYIFRLFAPPRVDNINNENVFWLILRCLLKKHLKNLIVFRFGSAILKNSQLLTTLSVFEKKNSCVFCGSLILSLPRPVSLSIGWPSSSLLAFFFRWRNQISLLTHWLWINIWYLIKRENYILVWLWISCHKVEYFLTSRIWTRLLWCASRVKNFMKKKSFLNSIWVCPRGVFCIVN